MKNVNEILYQNKIQLESFTKRLNQLNDNQITHPSKEFQIKELIGRIKCLETIPKSNLGFSEGVYDCYDAFILNDDGEIKTIIEIKDRTIESWEYDETILEYKKYTRMIEYGKKNGIKYIYYMVHFSDDLTAMWRLDKLKDPKVITKKNPKETVSSEREMINKQIILLPIDDAKIIYRGFSREEYKGVLPFKI